MKNAAIWLFATWTLVVPCRAALADGDAGRRPGQTDVAPAKEAPRKALSLREALGLMRQKNLAIIAARLDVDAARADVVAAGVFYNPTLSVNGSFFLTGEPTGAKQALNVIVDDVIPLGGQVGLREEVARRYQTAAERDLAVALWGLGADVRDAYLALQLAQKRRDLYRSAARDLERVEEIVGTRATEGANASYDLVRVKVESSDLAAQTASAESDLVDARVALARAIGKGVDTSTLEASDDLPPVPDVPTDDAATAEPALEARPDVVAARARLDAASVKIKQTQREYVPSPDVAFGVSPWFNVPTATGNKPGFGLYAGVSIPLPILDHGQGRVDRARVEEKAAANQVELTSRAAELDVSRARAALAGRVAAYKRYQSSSGAQIETLRSMADSSYREGKTGILELLDAYRSALAARGAELDLRGAALSAALDLERALGKGG
jgi:cobalt-zinc-cadmium efflux system outer membrane protein